MKYTLDILINSQRVNGRLWASFARWHSDIWSIDCIWSRHAHSAVVDCNEGGQTPSRVYFLYFKVALGRARFISSLNFLPLENNSNPVVYSGTRTSASPNGEQIPPVSTVRMHRLTRPGYRHVWNLTVRSTLVRGQQPLKLMRTDQRLLRHLYVIGTLRTMWRYMTPPDLG